MLISTVYLHISRFIVKYAVYIVIWFSESLVGMQFCLQYLYMALYDVFNP